MEKWLASGPCRRPDPADVFFDMEGYPLGCRRSGISLWRVLGSIPKRAPWSSPTGGAHDRDGEKLAYEGFVDWVFARWNAFAQPAYLPLRGPYEVSAPAAPEHSAQTRVRRKSTRCCAQNVFVDLYQLLRHGLRIGVDSYSIKAIEHLYRPGRTGDVATAMGVGSALCAPGSEVMRPGDWHGSKILEAISRVQPR